MYRIYNGYNIYDNGKVFSIFENKFITPFELNGHYAVYILVDNVYKSVYIYELIYRLFGKLPDEYLTDNYTAEYIDGDSSNCNISNIKLIKIVKQDNELSARSIANIKRWSDIETKKRIAAKISKTIRERGSHAGRKNSMFRYIILDENNNEYMITDIMKKFNMGYSSVYTNVRKYVNGERTPKFDQYKLKVIDTRKEKSIDYICVDKN